MELLGPPVRCPNTDLDKKVTPAKLTAAASHAKPKEGKTAAQSSSNNKHNICHVVAGGHPN
jgi:hypothetical protein